MKTSDPPIVHVVGAAIVDGRRCLAAQRSEAMPLPLKWEFPGGKVGHGETAVAALRREIEEEVAVTIEVGALLGRGIDDSTGVRVALDVYLAWILEGEIRLTEHRGCGWFEADALRELDWAAADRPVLPALIAWLDAQTGDVPPSRRRARRPS